MAVLLLNIMAASFERRIERWGRHIDLTLLPLRGRPWTEVEPVLYARPSTSAGASIAWGRASGRRSSPVSRRKALRLRPRGRGSSPGASWIG